MNKIILGFVGEISSGKGTAAKYLEEKYGATSHRFSTILRDVLNRLYLPIERKNLQDLSRTLRETFGQDLLAKIISQDVRNDPNKVVAVDGIRRFDDIIHLKQLPEFKLVYLTADMRTRYERIVKRGENNDDTSKTYEQFVKDHEAETELEITKVGATADIVIDNSGTLEDLYKKLDEIIINQ